MCILLTSIKMFFEPKAESSFEIKLTEESTCLIVSEVFRRISQTVWIQELDCVLDFPGLCTPLPLPPGVRAQTGGLVHKHDMVQVRGRLSIHTHISCCILQLI